MQEYLLVIGSRESFKLGFSSTRSALDSPDWSIKEGKIGPSPRTKKDMNFFSFSLSATDYNVIKNFFIPKLLFTI